MMIPMSAENTSQSPGKLSFPILLLNLAVPIFSLGGALLAIFFTRAGSSIDVRYFGIGCVLGSFILAYLAWIRPHKDIVALSTPIYSFLFFIIPSDVAVTLFLELLYGISLTILLIRLNARFGAAPSSGRPAEKVLEEPLKSYCESVHDEVNGIPPEAGHYAAVVFARFAQADYQNAADLAETAIAGLERTSSCPVLVTAFGIIREQALLLEESADQPDVFMDFLESDAGCLAKSPPPKNKFNDRFEASLDNALLLVYAAAWNTSVKDQPLLLVGQSFAQKLIA
jgi:hypothetical protein